MVPALGEPRGEPRHHLAGPNRQGVDAVCLHSGRTGEHLRSMLREAGRADVLQDASVVSAGPVTTEALHEQGFEVACTASSPGDDGMVRAVLELLGRA